MTNDRSTEEYISWEDAQDLIKRECDAMNIDYARLIFSAQQHNELMLLASIPQNPTCGKNKPFSVADVPIKISKKGVDMCLIKLKDYMSYWNERS
jgi:hypothetical protein